MDASERTRRLSELSVILNSPSFRSFPDKEIRAGGLHKLEPEVRDKHLSAALEVRRIAVAEDIIGSHSLVWKRTIGQGMFATVELFRLDRKAKRTKSLAGRIAAALDSIPCLAAQEDNRERYPNVVAAKVLRSHLLRSDNYTHGDKMPMYQVAFFQAEAALLKHLRHENIVETYGIVALPFGPRSLDTRLAILQEFCPGGTLKRRIRKVDYTASQGLAWLSDVARGMAFLHEETGFAIAHRDLKPDNVILTSTGVAKIADFGLSRLLDRSSAQLTPQESEHSITESDESDESSPASPNTPRADATGRVGSMRYMAPENILSQPYSCKVDVFSFGILAWEVLIGRISYEDEGLSVRELGRMVAHKGKRPPLHDSWPPALKNLLGDCWHHSPDKRPAFTEIEAALGALMPKAAGEAERSAGRSEAHVAPRSISR